MAKISVSNETDALPCLWVEPWGTDHWMRPGDAFTVVTETKPEASDGDHVSRYASALWWSRHASSWLPPADGRR